MSWSHMIAFLAGIPVGVVIVMFVAAMMIADAEDR